MIKNTLISISTLILLTACGGEPTDVVKVSKRDCSFRVIGHDKVGNNSAAIVKLNNTDRIMQIKIKSGNIPNMQKIRARGIKGYCVETIARSGDRVSSYEVNIPQIAKVGDSNEFNAN